MRRCTWPACSADSPREGRGFDSLPADVLANARRALPAALDRGELLRCLGAAIELLLEQAGAARELAMRTEPSLRELTAPWDA